MKKVIMLILTIVMALGVVSVSADSDIGVIIDGTPVVFTDAYPYVDNGRTLVPVRAVADAMGATVGWDDRTSTVTLVKDLFSVKLQLNTFKLEMSNGSQSVDNGMDCRAITKKGRTYIPARFVGYALGYEVGWNDPNVIFTYTGKQITDYEISADVKFPNKMQGIRPGTEYSYYDGYGDVKVAFIQKNYVTF